MTTAVPTALLDRLLVAAETAVRHLFNDTCCGECSQALRLSSLLKAVAAAKIELPEDPKLTRPVEEIRQRIAEIRGDERMGYKPAHVWNNAPLALIQLEGSATVEALEWALGESPGCAGSFRTLRLSSRSIPPETVFGTRVVSRLKELQTRYPDLCFELQFSALESRLRVDIVRRSPWQAAPVAFEALFDDFVIEAAVKILRGEAFMSDTP